MFFNYELLYALIYIIVVLKIISIMTFYLLIMCFSFTIIFTRTFEYLLEKLKKKNKIS